ncbi:MAG: NAD(P)/FAD-dependent oxidoreductase [Neomegalonema sp.]|nr:NAD(P)/FAD-dependent oxidoreductase [Neomegalonema sp.]
MSDFSKMLGAPLNPSRRRAIRNILLGGAALSVGARAVAGAKPVATKARIVVVGAGAAGLGVAARLSQRLDGAKITILDARKRHLYQPGFTLIAAGLHGASYSVTETAHWIPRNVDWIEEAAAAFDPAGNSVTTTSGKKISYDFLVVAAGIQLDYASVAGMDVAQIGKNGLGSVYASPEAAEATYRAMSAFTDKGGRGLFHRPATEIKCAGAPLKYTFITDDAARRKGNRGKVELLYAAHNKSFFSVPIFNEKIRMLFEDRGVKSVKDHVIKAIDIGARRASFDTPTGVETIDYDFINLVPPMRAPEAVRNSELPWKTGGWAADGWIEVDKHSLRHPRFPNVFAVGDIAGVPKGKTAASAKWQVPVAVDHLVADIAGGKSTASYTGYTSCPLITKIGRAMLVEFDYNNNIMSSFPGVISPFEELWVTWLIKAIGLKPTYYAMLRGEA